MGFQETYDRYLKVRKELDEYVIPFLVIKEDDFTFFKCPNCKKVHYRGIMDDPGFTHIIICCERILVKEK